MTKKVNMPSTRQTDQKLGIILWPFTCLSLRSVTTFVSFTTPTTIKKKLLLFPLLILQANFAFVEIKEIHFFLLWHYWLRSQGVRPTKEWTKSFSFFFSVPFFFSLFLFHFPFPFFFYLSSSFSMQNFFQFRFFLLSTTL